MTLVRRVHPAAGTMRFTRLVPFLPLVVVAAACSSSASAPSPLQPPKNDPTPSPNPNDGPGPTPPPAPPTPYPPDASTAVVVGLDVEDFRPTLGMSLEKVHLVTRVDGQVATDETIDLRSGGAIPHETTLKAPQGKTSAAIDVTVEGFVPQSTDTPPPGPIVPNVVRLASTHFTPGQVRLLPLRLEARCASHGPDLVGGTVWLGPTCDAPQTCIADACASSAVDAGSLPPYSPTWPADMPDACRAGAPSVTVGTGETDWAPLHDGDTVTVIEGGQCGHHVWLGAKITGLRQFDSRTLVSGAQPGGPTAPDAEFDFGYGDAGGGACAIAGLRYQLDTTNGGTAGSWKDFLGKPLDLTVTVQDSTGKSQSAKVHVNVAPTYQQGPRPCP